MRWMVRTIKGILIGLIVCFSVVFTTQTAHAQFDPTNIRAVDQAATGANNGLSWADAYTDLQDALDEADEIGSPVTSIWVAQGTYVPTELDPGQLILTFNLLNGVAMYGGFLGTADPQGGESMLDQRDPEANETIISGDILGDDDLPGGGTTDNVWRFVRAINVDETTILNGFTLSGGFIESPSDGTDGGAMIIIFANPRIVRCTFEGNVGGNGGAVFVSAIVPSSGPIFVNCIFKDNIALAASGGGVSIDRGGEGSFVTFHNCLFSGNTVPVGHGGGIGSVVADLMVINCTFEGNDAFLAGGGINFDCGDATLVNSIFWGNTDIDSGTVEEEQIFVGLNATVTVSYTCIEGLDIYTGNNNIGVNPEFVDEINGDFRLIAISPCIDTADNIAIPDDVGDLNDNGNTGEETPYDLDLLDRTQDSSADCVDTVDMGAYEFQPCLWDLDDDCSVGASDLLLLLGAWGTDPGGPPDFDCNSEVGAFDLLSLLANWGLCPCGVGAEPLSLEEELADACLTMDDWDAFVDVMTDPNASQADKDNYLCWMLHYLEECSKCFCTGQSGCPGPDPYNG